MPCTHSDVEHIESDFQDGEIYGDVYGRCRDCGCFVKAFGVMEDCPNQLHAAEPWQIDTDAMSEVMP